MINIHDITTYLPHRYPFLFVDKIIELIPNQSITTLKNITINEPFFQGHFPNQPMMPGVMILEAMTQTASILETHTQDNTSAHSYPYILAAIDAVKFKKQVLPGDQLTINAHIHWKKQGFSKYRVSAHVHDHTVCTADITGYRDTQLTQVT